MSRKRYTPEQIISMLREAEVALAQGQSVGQACRTLGVSEQSYYRWRKEYGGLRTDQAKRLKDLEKENGRLRKAISDLTLDKLILKEALEGKLLSPARRRQCVDHLQAELGISERRACAVAGQHRSTQRKRPRGRDDEEALTAAVIRLASQYGRYGYRRITALLRTESWHVNAKRGPAHLAAGGAEAPTEATETGQAVAHALAYNLANFMRTLALPKEVEYWSLTTLREKLVKIGAKVVSHGRYVTFQLAEVVVPRELFRKILSLIDDLRPRPAPA